MTTVYPCFLPLSYFEMHKAQMVDSIKMLGLHDTPTPEKLWGCVSIT